MIKYIKGDLIKAFDRGDVDILLHQCNCVTGTRVSGFAKALQDKYPEINEVLEQDNTDNFGKVKYTYITEDQIIANMFSQYYSGEPSKKYFISKYQMPDSFYNRTIALSQCIKDILYEEADELITFGSPLLASGLAKDKTKDYMSDLDYFIKYIAPVVEECFKPWENKIELNVYYL